MRKKYLVEFLDTTTYTVNYHVFTGFSCFSDDENAELAKLDFKRTNKDAVILGVYVRIF